MSGKRDVIDPASDRGVACTTDRGGGASDRGDIPVGHGPPTWCATMMAPRADLAAAPFKLNSVSVRDDALAGGSLRQSCVRSPICGPDCTGQARS